MFVLVHPRFEVAIGTFDSKRQAAAYKGRHPEFSAGVIVPLLAESEAAWILAHPRSPDEEARDDHPVG